MVVDEVGKVVLNEVLPRHSKVYWIPIVELTTQLPGRGTGVVVLVQIVSVFTHLRDSGGISVAVGSSPPKKM